jgi:hypothetical protein
MGRSIIEQVEEEKAQKVKDEALRNELRGRIGFWKSRGYIVARLLKCIDGDMRQARQAFVEFEVDVRRLSELQLRLNNVDVMGFPEDVLAIRQKLNDPDAVDDLEGRLGQLEGMIKARKDDERKRQDEQSRLEKEKKMGWYRQRIAAWAEKGYSTKRLDGVLDDPAADSATVEKKLTAFDTDIQRLLELGKRLESARTAATEEELKLLDRQLLDPEAADKADERIDELDQRIYQRKSQDDKRRQLLKRLEDYRQKGYKVARLEGTADFPLEKAEGLFSGYEADVGALFRLWDRLRALNRSYFPQDWEAARAMMNDPDMVADVETRVAVLETRQAQLGVQKAQEAKQLVSSGKALIVEMNEKMKSRVPDYNPLGFFIENGRWDPQIAPDGLSVRAETRPALLSKETVAVACELTGGFVPSAFMTEAERARQAGRYVARCFMMAQAPPEMAELAKGFTHPNLSAYVLDLGSNVLHCNCSDIKTRVFAGWFLKGQVPGGMRDAVKMAADKLGIFTRAGLELKLGLRRSEIDDMVKGWMAKNEVVQVSKIRDEYSFMD